MITIKGKHTCSTKGQLDNDGEQRPQVLPEAKLERQSRYAQINEKQQKSNLNLDENDVLYFLHIPKTGGTTLISLLDDHFHHNLICHWQSWDELLPSFPNNISKFQLFRGHFGYGFYRFLSKKPVYITFLRDPIERTISDFENYRRTPHLDPTRSAPHSTELDFILENNLLLEYLQHPHYGNYLKNTQTRFVGLDIDLSSAIKSFLDKKNEFHFLSYSEFLSPNISDEDMLKAAKQNLSKFAFVGITEKFQESVNLLCYLFGWKPVKNIPQLNIGKDRKKRQDFSKDTIDKISECTKLDQELYQYAQKIFEESYLQMEKNLREKYYDPSLSQLSYEELIYRLLEKHYEEHIRASNYLTTLVYDFRQSLSGSGWYPREEYHNSGTMFRWTGPDTISTIDLKLEKGKDLQIKIHILIALSEDILKTLRLEVNDHPIEVIVISHNEEGAIFEGIIPKSKLEKKDSFTTISITVGRTICHNSINSSSDDKRLLGLAVDKIEIRPIKSILTHFRLVILSVKRRFVNVILK